VDRNRVSKRITFLFPATVALGVALLGCRLAATPTPPPDDTAVTVDAPATNSARLGTQVGALATANARLSMPMAGLATTDAGLSTQVAGLGTMIARQATQVASQATLISYLATRGPASPAAGRPTFTPAPTNVSTRTPTPPPVSSFPAPDGSQVALIRDRGTLIVQDESGQQRELVVSDEISSLAWFPDGRHIIYSEQDPAQPVVNRQDALWIVNIETAERDQVGTGYDPHVSPDGRHVAVLSGVLWGDACHVGYDVAILELDAAMQVVTRHDQDDFTGVPEEGTSESIYPVAFSWQSDTQLAVMLAWACSDVERSTYVLDLATLEAEKVD